MNKEKIYKQALQNIISPIAYMQEEARRSGGKLNGLAAQLIKLPSFYQQIAREALEKAESEADHEHTKRI